MASIPQQPQRRQINPDGTVNIICRNCGKLICRSMYRGFSTAICTECAEGKTPIDATQAQEEVSLYNVDEAPKQLFGTVRNWFRALGFGEKPAEAPGSVQKAKKKVRRGLFEEPDSGKSTGAEDE